MKSKSTSLVKVISAAIIICGYLVYPFMVNPNSGASLPGASAAGPTSYSLYIPMINNGSATTPSQAAPQPPIFGAEMWNITTGGGLDLIAKTNATWTRRNAVLWSSVEPNDPNGGTPAYNWSGMATLESDLVNASNNGLELILVIDSAPEWARKIAGTGSSCGPIAQNKLAAFGDFMQAVVARYGAAPYNVKYYELWNEEDAPYVEGDNIWGCWGDGSDAYNGGGYYAEMLKVVYPKIKATDAQALVLIGGLMMDCNAQIVPGCSMSKYLEGILRNNGAPYFDGVSFHAYDHYLGVLGKYYNPNWASAWNTTGPTAVSAAEFIKNTLSKYNVTGKFLINTEVSLLCGDAEGNVPPEYGNMCTSADFDNTKAYFLVQNYTAALAEGLRASIWYCVADGWRHSGLLLPQNQISPAYTAFMYAQGELRNAAYAGDLMPTDIGGVEGVKGYKFLRDGHKVWVIWSLDGSTHSIRFSSGTPTFAADVLGIPVIPKASMSVSLKPIYLEWAPIG
jgi:hypothetical protein